MKQPASLLALALLLGAAPGIGIRLADAQPRLPPGHAPATPAPPAPPAVAGPRDVRWVVNHAGAAWASRCVATVGCEAPRTVPRCAPGVRARSLADVADPRLGLAGQRVSVRGRLSAGGGCTEMACPQGVCCNACDAGVVLVASGPAANPRRSLALAAGDHDAAFACRGDDSGLCCGTEVPAGDVVVTGTLRPVLNSGGEWRIESPALCAM